MDGGKPFFEILEQRYQRGVEEEAKRLIRAAKNRPIVTELSLKELMAMRGDKSLFDSVFERVVRTVRDDV